MHSREMRAFGETAQTGIDDRWRFPGQLHSSEVELYYNYFRDYAPRMGRYVQSDPVGLFGGVNEYQYVGANPPLRSDPKGLFGVDDPFDSLPRSPFPDLDFICRFLPRCKDEIDVIDVIAVAYAENECELKCSAKCVLKFAVGEARDSMALRASQRIVERYAKATARTWLLRGIPVVGWVSTGRSGGHGIVCTIDCWRI